MISSLSKDAERITIDHSGERGLRTRQAAEATTATFLILPSPSGWLPADPDQMLKPLRTLEAEAVYATPAGLTHDRVSTSAKAFRTSLLRGLPFGTGAGFDLEVTRRLTRRQARILYQELSGQGPVPAPPSAFTRLSTSIRAHGAMLLDDRLYLDPGAAILDSFSIAHRFNHWMADTIRPFLGRKVLEIGAGVGNMASELVAGKERYIATDLDVEHLARLTARLGHLGYVEAHIADLSQPNVYADFRGQVDSVVCLNVLEHVGDAPTGLANMYDVLAPGGRAIVLVPCGQELYGSLDVVLGHYQRYSREELRQKMTAAGFEVETVLEFNRVSRPAWFINARILKRTGIRKAQLRLFDRTVWFWRVFDRFLPWGPTSVIGIGRKP